jgi:hypothetical protein
MTLFSFLQAAVVDSHPVHPAVDFLAARRPMALGVDVLVYGGGAHSDVYCKCNIILYSIKKILKCNAAFLLLRIYYLRI